MVCLGISIRWTRRKKDGVPKKFCGSVRCGSLRWSRHRKDGVRAGKMVCLGNFVAQ